MAQSREAVGDRPGGYVRIIRTGYRHGDAADLAMIELVDFNPDYNGQAKAGDTSKARSAVPVVVVVLQSCYNCRSCCCTSYC
ncbi:MAG: hypothetical protein IPM82_14800 [Saprospiraceae bacterium]|nr:hypothetical protein [Saprospiraceae bacterium]